MEHRWGDRIRSGAAVRLLAHPATVAWGRLRDISRTGAFIETRLVPPLLSTLLVARLPASTTGAATEVGAVVVRNDPEGIGIEWFDGDADAVCEMLEEARASLQWTPKYPLPLVNSGRARV